jgi:hypothetical protein
MISFLFMAKYSTEYTYHIFYSCGALSLIKDVI